MDPKDRVFRAIMSKRRQLAEKGVFGTALTIKVTNVFRCDLKANFGHLCEMTAPSEQERERIFGCQIVIDDNIDGDFLVVGDSD